MRSIPILSGLAVLTLAATALAQTAPRDSGAAPTSTQDASGDKPTAPSMKPDARDQATAKADKNGYNTKTTGNPPASELKPRTSKWPGYYQSSDIPREESKPYGPPR